MEHIIRFFITLAIITAILLGLILLAVLIHYLRTRSKAEKLLKSGKRDGDFLYELLKTSFPSGRLFKNIVLPLILPDGTARRISCNLLLVDRGGVYLIRALNMSGAVDNSNPQTWTVRNNQGIGEIPNPFEQNRACLKAVSTILSREGVYNVPLFNIVVFSGRKVVFRTRMDKLLTAEHLIGTIQDQNREKVLSPIEIGNTVAAIRKYLISPKPRRDSARNEAE